MKYTHFVRVCLVRSKAVVRVLRLLTPLDPPQDQNRLLVWTEELSRVVAIAQIRTPWTPPDITKALGILHL